MSTCKCNIITTISSTIVSSKIADATNRQEKIYNLHFFNSVLGRDFMSTVHYSLSIKYQATC
ncbi:3-hydroxyacyl-CoA dehydrogenase NAD-binding domain-containing protein [Oceanobacillus longus]|uniref:3-hydroxyacyl-CoA dehydrogenase NAD-binding domain-containing protein n=1 Tax=Oceanobacillus longus TaxID=930120 RepID=A0ABV8GZL4_9BACI